MNKNEFQKLFANLPKPLPAKKRSNYDRFAVVSLDRGIEWIKSGKAYINYNGATVSVGASSLRIMTFLLKGIKCQNPGCQMEGRFFAIERSWPPKTAPKKKHPMYGSYHLNLYAYTPNGNEVLMTHDHITARALGGKDTIDNSQTMCSPCNSKKAKLESIIAREFGKDKKVSPTGMIVAA